MAGEHDTDRNVTLPTVIVGEELFSKGMRIYLGSTVDLICPMCNIGPSGATPRLRGFRVAGHFYSGMYEYDSKLVYISLAEAQKFFGMPGEVSGIDIRIDNPERAGEVAAAVKAALGPGFDVRSWEEMNRSLFMALRLEKIAMFIVLAFIGLVASFSIVANLIMLVTEKAREIAILKAMGTSDRSVLRIFLTEGLYIGLLGLSVGILVGVTGCVMIEKYGLPLPTDVYYISKLPIVMRTHEITLISLLAVGLCCAATIYPAVLASRLRPVDGLRYE